MKYYFEYEKFLTAEKKQGFNENSFTKNTDKTTTTFSLLFIIRWRLFITL